MLVIKSINCIIIIIIFCIINSRCKINGRDITFTEQTGQGDNISEVNNKYMIQFF